MRLPWEKRDYVGEFLRDSHFASRRDAATVDLRLGRPDLRRVERRDSLDLDRSSTEPLAPIHDCALELIGDEQLVGTTIWR
jgi:hypothetical protein